MCAYLQKEVGDGMGYMKNCRRKAHNYGDQTSTNILSQTPLSLYKYDFSPAVLSSKSVHNREGRYMD